MSDQQQHSLYQSQNAASSAGSVNSSSATLGSGGLRSGGSIQGGRRPIIIRDDQQRVMLQSIRDSLAHLQKASPHSPGSDASGASGTSTPNKDSAQSKEGQAVAAASAKRSDTYNSAAMAKIKKSLQTFKKEDARDSVEVEATAKVNVRELIDQINPENRNGDLKSRLGGLVPTLPPNTIHSTSVRKVSKPKTAVLATSLVDNGLGTVSPPPPLPPRTRALTTPPPPLPPRESHSAVESGGVSTSSLTTNVVTSTYYTSSAATTGGAKRAPPPPSSHAVGSASAIPSATPASEMEQLAAQTGLTSQQIRDIVFKSCNYTLQQPLPQQQLYSEHSVSSANDVSALHPRLHAAAVDSADSAAAEPTDYHSHTNGDTSSYPPPPPHYHSAHNFNSSINSTPPPPPYGTAHQASPASSVTSGSSSNDYILMGYGYSPGTSTTGYTNSVQSAVPDYRNGATVDFRPSPTGAFNVESLSSGSSSPASLQGLQSGFGYRGGHNTGSYLYPPHPSTLAPPAHPANATTANNKNTLAPKPLKSRQAKQSIVAQSAHSQRVHRHPVVQQLTAPILPAQPPAPPSYTSSIQAQVAGGVTSRTNAVPLANRDVQGQVNVGSRGGGNVHIKLRSQQDPQLQVNGYPSFHVTAHNSQLHPHLAHSHLNTGHSRPSIQLHFSTRAAPPPLEPPHLRRRGSLETRSDSPVSRTTNHSPLSMISTTSTNSDCVVPERPPPPYPGSRQHTSANQPHSHPTGYPAGSFYNHAAAAAVPSTLNLLNVEKLATVDSSPDPSEPEQSETESESDRRSGRTMRCTSPKPQLRPDGDIKDDDKLKHYSPAAFKFYMEQHIENVLKQHKERVNRRIQLEKEMSKVDLSDDAKDQMRKMLKQKETNYLRLKRAKMNRSMFEVISKLGIGAFGEVSLVRKKVVEKGEPLGDQLYAMKTLRKVDVIRRNQVAHVKAERDILAEAELEWVTKLYYSFQDTQNLYFIMEYIPGGDLMALLIKKGIFEEPLARFYIAELVLAIESVHKMGFIHRDIKPDNVLIDKDGHLKLTDFGLCTGFRWTHNSKYYQEGGHNRQDSMDPQDMTSDPCHCPKELPKILEKRRRREKQRCLAHSLVGTPNYIAPEVLLRTGYTKSCDWWSVGVILYEMLVGQPPFLANTPKETQYKVVHYRNTLHIPIESELSLSSQNLIMNLCTGPENRLGREGAEQIKKHSFFKPLNFSDIRRQKAPFVPVIKYPTDTSNFDEVEEQQLPNYNPDDLRQNGHYPEHAFSEFTFRRFFDDGGHARPLNMTESLSFQIGSLALGNSNINNGGHLSSRDTLSEEKTPQNSCHEEDVRPAGTTNPVYV